MNAALETLRAEKHVSFSAIGSYLRCPRQYQFRYVDKVPSGVRPLALAFGTSVHEALAAFYNALKNGEEPAEEEVFDAFRECWKYQIKSERSVLLNEGETAADVVATGIEMLRVFLAKSSRPYRVIEVETPWRIEVYDPYSGEVLPVRLLGVFDAVIQNEDGGYEILEHKTAARRWAKDRLANDLQITSYTMAANAMGLGNAPVTIQLLLKTKQPDFEVYKPTRSEHDHVDFLSVACGVLRAIGAEAFYPKRDWHCKGCSYLELCVRG